MATTLDNIIGTIRAEDIVPATQVNFGTTDQLAPPYVSVTRYDHAITYDTAGPVFKDVTFKVLVVDKTSEGAEEIATQVDAVLNGQGVTPTAQACFQEAYSVGQMAERLYQFGVEISYAFKENLR